MKAIIENNKVRLVNDYSIVNCTITVPFKNIERMKQATNCKIINVKSTSVNFNHNAGKLAKVTIDVRFSQIEKYLGETNAGECENFDSYLDLLGKKQGRFSSLCHTERMLKNCNQVRLYAFGDLNLNYKYNDNNTHYINKNGRKISLNGKNDNYVNFKGEWFRKLNKTA
jgi:hypothetical protein